MTGHWDTISGHSRSYIAVTGPLNFFLLISFFTKNLRACRTQNLRGRALSGPGCTVMGPVCLKVPHQPSPFTLHGSLLSDGHAQSTKPGSKNGISPFRLEFDHPKKINIFRFVTKSNQVVLVATVLLWEFLAVYSILPAWIMSAADMHLISYAMNSEEQ